MGAYREIYKFVRFVVVTGKFLEMLYCFFFVCFCLQRVANLRGSIPRKSTIKLLIYLPIKIL